MTTYVKVSELPASTVLADADVFIYNDDTTTSKITYANLKAGVLTGVGSTATTFAGAVTFSDAVTFGTGTITGLDKADVGLASVDNTSDAAKPVSTLTQSALNLKANLSGPTFTGVPSAPTAVAGTNTTQIATTAFVAEAITTDNVTDALLASPALTGTPTAPTAASGTNTTQVATTAFVTAAITADNATDLILGTSSIDALGDVDTTTTAPSSGDFLKFDGSNFVPGLPAAPTTFELDGTTLRNVTGGHTFALRNAALANTISLNTETGGADFADRVYSTEYRAVGTGHLKLRAETGNDLNIYLNDTETLQITRDPSTGNPKFTAVGGTGECEFLQSVNLVSGFKVGGTSVTATADELNYLYGVTSSVQTQLDAKALASAITNVDNTSDADKPVSTATQTALDLKASLAGATFTGDVIVDEGTGATVKLETTDPNSAGIHIEGPSGSHGYIDTTNGFGNDTLQIYSANTWIRAINGGTGNLIVDGTAKFNQDVTQRPGSSVTPSANGDLNVEATSDTTLTFKFKGSDGVVRSGTITLS